MDVFIDLFNQHNRRLVTLANIVLVVLMSLSVANTVLFFVKDVDEGTVAPTAHNVARPGATQGDRVDLSQLSLFGTVEKAAPVAVDAPETSLNLELQGVFTAANPEESTAIIAESNKSGKLYEIGDRLPGNAVLKAVFDDHILIKRGDRLEKLMFSNAEAIKQQFGVRAAPPSVYRPPPAVSRVGSLPSSRLQELRQRIEARRHDIAEQTRQPNSPGSTIRDYVEHFHKEIQSNPGAVLHNLGVSPVTAGKANGYRIGGNIPQQMLAQAGLQQGDVILSVNGSPVGNVRSDSSLVDQALAAGRVRVEVQRGERKFFLTVPIPESR